MIHVAPSLWSALITLLVTIGPIETSAVFSSLTTSIHKVHRQGLATRAILIAGVVLLVFGIAGRPVLSALHVSMPAFRVAGGVLLFLQAVTLTFSNPGLSSINEGERNEAQLPGDIAVFPLAFPLIAGPGALSAMVLLMGRTNSALEALGVIVMLLICLTVTYGAMLGSERLAGMLGKTGTDVIGRISGVLLAALAVQFVFDGVGAAAGLAGPIG
jgi:multiple antibiotic resistance protein